MTLFKVIVCFKVFGIPEWFKRIKTLLFLYFNVVDNAAFSGQMKIFCLFQS